jgi:hypothetical protein
VFEFIVITTLFTVNGVVDKQIDLVMGKECLFSYKHINHIDRTISVTRDGLIKKKGKVLIAKTCRTKKQILQERHVKKASKKNTRIINKDLSANHRR